MAYHNNHEHNRVNSQEFSRDVCKYNEEYMQPILDNIYRMMDIQTERVYDKDRQVSGADVVFHSDKQTLYLDEKVCSSKPLYVPNGHSPEELAKETRDSYGMELSTLNRRGERVHGWFHPAERNRAINGGYVITWINSEKDQRYGPNEGKLSKVSQLEFCIVPYDKLLGIVDKALDGMHIDDKVGEILGYVEARGCADQKRVFYHNPLGDQGVRFSYNGHKPRSQSITCMIPKEMIREMSFVNYAFNLTGELGREGLVSFRNLKDQTRDEFRPIDELKQDIKDNPIGFPKPHYLSLEDKKERIMASMDIPAKAFTMVVPYEWIVDNSENFLRHSESGEKALVSMMREAVSQAHMTESKYFPLFVGMNPDYCKQMTPREKMDTLVNAILKDHDKLSEHYTIKALEDMHYKPQSILVSTSSILPNNLVALEERISKTKHYIDKKERRGFHPYDPRKERQQQMQRDLGKRPINDGPDGRP